MQRRDQTSCFNFLENNIKNLNVYFLPAKLHDTWNKQPNVFMQGEQFLKNTKKQAGIHFELLQHKLWPEDFTLFELQ